MKNKNRNIFGNLTCKFVNRETGEWFWAKGDIYLHPMYGNDLSKGFTFSFNVDDSVRFESLYKNNQSQLIEEIENNDPKLFNEDSELYNILIKVIKESPEERFNLELEDGFTFAVSIYDYHKHQDRIEIHGLSC